MTAFNGRNHGSQICGSDYDCHTELLKWSKIVHVCRFCVHASLGSWVSIVTGFSNPVCIHISSPNMPYVWLLEILDDWEGIQALLVQLTL
ncbi:hypothetical protein P8452_37183 [Trifolium repens]|nr:hypothetical protein P8452_37183 [Trifolium repens]